MAKVKYFAKENKKVGTHSFYAVPQPNGTLTFDELCEEACENTTIEASILRAAVTEYMKVVKRNVLKGFRVPLGDQFITVYPNLQLSVKDTKDEHGNLVVATAKMLNAANGKSRLGATVSPKFSQEFASSVSWQKVDKNGAPVDDEEDDITDGSDTPGGGGSDGGSSGSETLAAPTISGNTTFTESTEVSIAAAAGAEIRYTLDGSTPTASSTLYSTAITLTETTTVKAIAIKDGQTSEVASKTFVKSSGEGGMDQN